jgi:hypothetical protein
MWSFKSSSGRLFAGFYQLLAEEKAKRAPPIINLSIINHIGRRNRPTQPTEPTKHWVDLKTKTQFLRS